MTIGFVESVDNGRTEKFKCDIHNFYTNDSVEFEKHKRDAKLSHIEQCSNVECFHCGGMITDKGEEGVEYRHRITGKATHRKCRIEMAAEFTNNATVTAT